MRAISYFGLLLGLTAVIVSSATDIREMISQLARAGPVSYEESKPSGILRSSYCIRLLFLDRISSQQTCGVIHEVLHLFFDFLQEIISLLIGRVTGIQS